MTQTTLVEHLDRPRLDSVDGRVWQALAQDGGWVPRSRLIRLTHGAAINSSISRLRKRYGYSIESRRDPDDPASGNWEYRLRGCRTVDA